MGMAAISDSELFLSLCNRTAKFVGSHAGSSSAIASDDPVVEEPTADGTDDVDDVFAAGPVADCSVARHWRLCRCAAAPAAPAID